MKSFNFLVAIVAITTAGAGPIVGRIWYEIPLAETADIAKVTIAGIGFCYMLFKFKES